MAAAKPHGGRPFGSPGGGGDTLASLASPGMVRVGRENRGHSQLDVVQKVERDQGVMTSTRAIEVTASDAMAGLRLTT